MVSYIIRRLLLIIPTLLVISLLVFIIIELPPGDYIESYIAQLEAQGETADIELLEFLRHQYGLSRAREPVRDLGDVLRAFPRAEHDFGEASTQCSVVIDFREAEIFEAQDPELLARLVRGHIAALDGFQDFTQALGAHGGEFSPMKALSAPRSRHTLAIASTKNGTYSRSFTHMRSSHGCPGVARYAEW